MTRVLQAVVAMEKTTVTGGYLDSDERGEFLVVSVRAHARARSLCPVCRRRCAGYDRAQVRRWRHTDMGSVRCYVESMIRRVECPDHGVLTEMVPWARPAARMTRPFDDTVAWLTAHSPATAVCDYLRISWRTVQRTVSRVVADYTGTVDLLDGLRRIGIDEIAYRKGHRYLCVIVDHDTGRLVWACEGATKESLQAFFDALGPGRTAELTHISSDGARYIEAMVAERAPHVIWCLDPFHVVQWVTQAMDRCRQRVLHRIAGLSMTDRRNLRWALMKNPDNLTPAQRRVRKRVINGANRELARAYQIKEQLRLIVTGQTDQPDKDITRWLTRAQRSHIPEMRGVAKSIEAWQTQIYNAIVTQMSNARSEATNTHLRALTKRAYGFHSAEALLAMATLTRSGACPALPGR